MVEDPVGSATLVDLASKVKRSGKCYNDWNSVLLALRSRSNQSALESRDPRASSGGSNIEIQPLEADLLSFEVARDTKQKVYSLTETSVIIN